jgi:hypothetical protein
VRRRSPSVALSQKLPSSAARLGSLARTNLKTVAPVVALALAVLLLFTSFFTWSHPVPRRGRQVAADFMRAAQQVFTECHDVECLRQANAVCRPAHFTEKFSTLEGSLVTVDSFVLKDGPRCSVIGFYDYTVDYWGGCRLSKRTCPSIEAMRSRSWDSEGCSQVVLEELKPCEP